MGVQITCQPGDQLVGFVTIATHVLIAIAPVCGNRKKDPMATYETSWAGGKVP